MIIFWWKSQNDLDIIIYYILLLLLSYYFVYILDLNAAISNALALAYTTVKQVGLVSLS